MQEKETMKDIFICHDSEDKPFVRELARTLKSYGIRVWFDEWELNVGDSLHQRIGQAIQKSSFMLVVLSRTSAKKPWVQREMTAGLAQELNRKNVYVIPALLNINPGELPPMLADKLAADFRHDKRVGVKAILKRLGITDRYIRLRNPTPEDIAKAAQRLPLEQKWILLRECWRRSHREPSGDIRFDTQFLDFGEHRAILGLVHRDLIRVKMVHHGLFSDQDEQRENIPGWIYEGSFTNLGSEVAKLLNENEKSKI